MGCARPANDPRHREAVVALARGGRPQAVRRREVQPEPIRGPVEPLDPQTMRSGELFLRYTHALLQRPELLGQLPVQQWPRSIGVQEHRPALVRARSVELLQAQEPVDGAELGLVHVAHDGPIAIAARLGPLDTLVLLDHPEADEECSPPPGMPDIKVTGAKVRVGVVRIAPLERLRARRLHARTRSSRV